MQVKKTNSIEKSNKIDNINFKIKIMLTCYLRGIASISDMMSAVQMRGFIIAAISSRETGNAEITYAKHIAGNNPELKEYTNDPIKYVRLAETQNARRGNSAPLLAALVNPQPHIFATALVSGIDASQKQGLIAAEMMCKCISAKPRDLVLCTFITNIVHKIVMLEDSALFLVEILDESAKICCEYLPMGGERGAVGTIAAIVNENELLSGFMAENIEEYRPIYVICWVLRKMQLWINTFGKKRDIGNIEKIKALLKFYSDVLLDLEDVFAELIEKIGSPSVNNGQNCLLFILPLLNAISGVIVAAFCLQIAQREQLAQINEICLIYFSPEKKPRNQELYKIANCWIDGLLFE